MAQLMLGKDTAAAVKADLDCEIEELKARGITPRLDIIKVGDKPEDKAYENGARKRFEKLGLDLEVTELPEDVTEDEFEKKLADANDDPLVHGILVFRPLPEQLDADRIARLTVPEKDVDCFDPVNIAKVLTGESSESGFAPCTAEAAIEIGERNGIDFDGMKVTIIGRSMVVGRPLAMMLLQKNATVTVCHSHTADLKESCKDADVIISAAGCAGLVTADMVKDGACVIDIGINVTEDGKLTGDVDFDAVSEKAALITPVPGGVGGVTTSILARHVVTAAQRLAK
ncbi:MAG: bifunctional 5,10-methylene-tetrahydrofolate dehydrogenase/5,10-methylene-tetrahydrofolate cyclohydrolase [Eubacterium sp.]|nr:bifunctional 5,10-methylene-tetrahydrofolate dehydrogenase/5,10-methylene-tetrahydrofolate cyclohydrolase [Eubacterium sp.]